jgi:hypothetical protein
LLRKVLLYYLMFYFAIVTHIHTVSCKKKCDCFPLFYLPEEGSPHSLPPSVPWFKTW